MLTIVAGLIVLSELALAGVVYVSVAAPDRVPNSLRITPLYWRLVALFTWSVVSGAMIQMVAATHAVR